MSDAAPLTFDLPSSCSGRTGGEGMDLGEAGAGPVRAGEAGARLEARVRRVSLLWWAAVFVLSCLLNFGAETSPEWLSDVATYAAGSGVAAACSLLLAGWLSRRGRREGFGAGLALAALGGLASGAVAVFADFLVVGALKHQEIAVYQIGFDLGHQVELFLAWYFVCLLLCSVERTARIEEGVVRLRVLMLRAQDAALRERVRPDALGESFASVRAALAQHRRKDAERVVMALAEGLRAALSAHAGDASQAERRAFEGADLAEVGVIDREAPRFGAKFAAHRFVDRAFWAVVFFVLLVSFAPVYAQSALKTKLYALSYWASFCLNGYVCCAGFRYLWRGLAHWKARGRKIFAVTVIGIGAAFVSACLPAVVSALFWGRVAPSSQMILFGVVYYFPFYAIWHCLYFHAEAIRRETAQRAVLAQIAEAAAAARNSMLRYQVRPHFLFNALNALYVLIADECWERAGAMTDALSAYIERSFAEDERELVPICEQAEALQTYLSLERVRFGERLRVRVDISEGVALAFAPSLILQPLIENAMKYAVAATAEPVDVEIAAERAGEMLRLRVRDSGGDPEAPAAPGLGIGLRNVAARLAGHYGERGLLQCRRLTPKGFVAEIQLPLDFADKAGWGSSGRLEGAAVGFAAALAAASSTMARG